MSRSGYNNDDCDLDTFNLYRGNVDRSIRGKRGQAFLRELIAALDDLPEKKLIAESFATGEGVCALGSVARLRGITEKVSGIDPEDIQDQPVGRWFGIADCLAREIMYENDEAGPYWKDPESEERRWERIRRWAESNLLSDG